MLVRIVKRTFSGAEYCPEQKVLKLGGEGSTGVETLEFELPEEWAGMAVTVHVQQLDGTLPQPVLLGEDRCLEVDRMFTSSEKGLWMLRAMDGNGYCAMTRPARYECYETFTADGDTEITPSQYEAFVAQVLGAANTASQKAKDAQSAADRAEGAAGEAQKAKAAAADSVQQAKGEAESAQTAALSQSNCVVDGGNKKYKYFEIIVNNVEDLEVRNVIFWKGANMVLEGCKNIWFVNCTWEGINPNGVNKIWTCGIRLRGRMENGESIWCENIWIEGCIFQNVWYNPYVNNGIPQDVSDAAILP